MDRYLFVIVSTILVAGCSCQIESLYVVDFSQPVSKSTFVYDTANSARREGFLRLSTSTDTLEFKYVGRPLWLQLSMLDSMQIQADMQLTEAGCIYARQRHDDEARDLLDRIFSGASPDLSLFSISENLHPRGAT